MGGCKGPITTFIVEPFIPHNEEFYLNIVSDRLGCSISFSECGGIEIEENWDKVISNLMYLCLLLFNNLLFIVICIFLRLSYVILPWISELTKGSVLFTGQNYFCSNWSFVCVRSLRSFGCNPSLGGNYRKSMILWCSIVFSIWFCKYQFYKDI